MSEYRGRHELIGSGGDMPPTPARGIVAVFSENKKEGYWALPRHLRVLTVFGNVTIDLREAMILPGESVIEAIAVFAEVKVLVPPYLNVECDGDALMGEFGFKKSKRDEMSVQRPDPDAPFVRVIGSAYMASVTVRVKSEKKTPRRRALYGGST